MFTKLEIWLQVFLAALQALLHQPGTTHTEAIQKARAVADEAQTHMPAGMLIELPAPPPPAPAPTLAPVEITTGSNLGDTAALAAAVTNGETDQKPEGEDDLERDRR